MPQLTLVHTDIQGSTRLWDRLGHSFADVLADHNRILREAIAAHGGRELETEGDSFTISFPTAGDGVLFALAAQEALHAHPWPSDAGEILVRMGIHTGEAVVQGGAVAGPVPGRCRLIAGAGHGGQILLSEAARAAAGDSLSGAAVTDLGEHRLTPQDRSEHLVQALPLSLAGRAFPPLRTLTSRPTNIISARSRFVGRERELAVLAALVPQPAGRLVTLTGPGGIGKTRLACELGGRLIESFEGGCWIADLVEAQGVDGIGRAVARALGVPLGGGEDSARAVADVLEFRKSILIVLDGFEALTDHAAATVGLWMKRARHARFLVTSLSLLGLSGEREVPLEPLPVPGRDGRKRSAAEVGAFDGVKLFVDRAAMKEPTFALTEANAGEVADICSDLEGMPLAIELAAARLAEVGSGAMLRELEGRVPPDKGVPRRRQSFLGALEWSYGLLTPWQRGAFHQACVFRGGFYLEAAEEVIDLGEFADAPLAIDAVQALRDRSLLRTEDTPCGTRFAMFRSIRGFGEERLRELMPARAVLALEARHANHYLACAEQWVARIRSRDPGEGFDRLELERDNLLAAHERFVGREGGADLATRAVLALQELMTWRGNFGLLVPRLEASLASPLTSPDLEIGLASALANAWITMGRLDSAAGAVARARSIAERTGDRGHLAWACLRDGQLQAARGDSRRALEESRRAGELWSASGDRAGEARALAQSGTALKMLGEFDAGIRSFGQAIEIVRAQGDSLSVARYLANLGGVHKERGSLKEALRCYDEAGTLMAASNSPLNAAKIAGLRGLIYWEMNDLARARAGLLHAIAVHREMGLKPSLSIHVSNLGLVCQAEGNTDEAERLFMEAERMSRETGDREGIARAVGNRATVQFRRGDFEGALKAFEETTRIYGELGLRNPYALNRGNSGAAMWELGRAEEGRAAVEEALGIWKELGSDRTIRAFNLQVVLAQIEESLHHPEAAAAAARSALDTAGRLEFDPEQASEPIRQSMETARRIAAGRQAGPS